ncbi:MAG: TlpA disulfide reductase family protein, partial [Planctomycetota bacterium]
TIVARVWDGLAVDDLSPEQILTLNDAGLFQSDPGPDDAIRRCRALMGSQDDAGAMAALAHARLMAQHRGSRRGSARFITKAINVWLDHPAVMSTTRQAGVFFGELGWNLEYQREALAAVRDCSEGLERFAGDAFEDGSAPSLVALVQLAGVLRQAGMPDDKAERLRDRLKSDIDAMLAGELEGGDRFDLERAMDTLTRPEREAALVGNPMPAMDVIWSSDDAIDSFEDYRGKVLVLDFWATWCGPCIASFPQVRDLREKYSEDDVAIVGVTSLQGTHYPQGAPPVDTNGEPEREFALMADFIAEQGITWDVVFTEQEVFNPDYVIQGIPHVVIIDPEGIIRHRALHPTDPTKSVRIDAILEEFAPEGHDR